MNTNFHIGVNVLLKRDGKILLGLRKNCFGAGTWALPGGHLEIGETMVGGAARELLEETGLEAKSLKFSNIVNNPGREKDHYIQVGFFAEGVAGEPEIKEPDRCDEWRWFDCRALPENIFPNHKKQIELFVTNGGHYAEERG